MKSCFIFIYTTEKIKTKGLVVKTFNLKYSDNQNLEEFISFNNIYSCENILLQIFTGVCDYNFILTLVSFIKSKIPHIKIIGTTTSGEILDGVSLDNSTVLSFSLFDNTVIKTYSSKLTSNSYDTAKKIISKFDKNIIPNVAIAFSDGINTNGEDFVNAFSDYNKNLVISGGLAGDNGDFSNTIVFNEEFILEKGAVVALLYNDSLIVHTDASFGWQSIGKTMTITKSKGNVVYEVDNINIIDLYEKYLGVGISNKLPLTGIEFPFLVERGSVKIPRAVILKNDDKSLTFAGNLTVGDRVTFGYGNIENIIKSDNDLLSHNSFLFSESIFIYSCVARKTLMQDSVNMELNPFKDVASVSGFFTYGEFYCDDDFHKHELLNETMTLLSLSEKKDSKKIKKSENIVLNSDLELNPTLKALTNLIATTSRDLDDLHNTLELKVAKGIASIKMLNLEIEDTQKEIIFTMGAIGEERSKETGNHVRRVAEYSKILATHYGLKSSEIKLLKLASPMHDIGKVSIPDKILKKPGKLTKDEFNIMKNHAITGFQMLNKSKRKILKTASIIAYQHHEKWDGTGYPQGLVGEEIDILGRITAIADVFDALGSDRCYKKAWDDEDIFRLLIEQSGKHFDPKLIKIFFENLDEFLVIRNSLKDLS